MKLLRRLAALRRPPRTQVVNVYVQGSLKSEREIAEAIQRDLWRRPPNRAA